MTRYGDMLFYFFGSGMNRLWTLAVGVTIAFGSCKEQQPLATCIFDTLSNGQFITVMPRSEADAVSRQIEERQWSVSINKNSEGYYLNQDWIEYADMDTIRMVPNDGWISYVLIANGYVMHCGCRDYIPWSVQRVTTGN